MPEHDFRLLALDGGGVRGLSTLQIVKQLMDTIDPESPPKPCDYFDMIGGTSTGGCVVIALLNVLCTLTRCVGS
ncbi:FabD/lysophospholipase-like protein [Cenococcum geophilum 1.58]|uniref:FabD/lysophospholipase-like protein n=1 Tax=Cenococcum geophilum 1.58 TaxID=794803 RepID=UPI00358FC559|nr:FabD/lysophospholipase-like protein [Cenococcum geophilum 1.58]